MAVKGDLRTFKNAAWLGWQMEANWTDPFLFAVYSVVKPLAGTLILVFMYLVITGGETDNAFFSYMYVGNAMFMYAAEVLFGITWVIHDDREHYMTLKQVYIAPVNFYAYVFGRAAIKIVITSFGVLLTLAFGVLVLGVGIDVFAMDIPLLVSSLVLGLLFISVVGLALGGVSFLTAKHAEGINEGVAGVFAVFSGVLFPLTILPSWMHPFSKVLPMTYWMEAVRRGLMPETMSELDSSYGYDVTGLASYDNMFVSAVLLLSVAVFFVFSFGLFRYADIVARRKGKIDWTSAY
ncbi:MAG: ABC transporter permease [Thermoplasmata archaeon]|jgi:ABC-2 type transport system permease protein|nr:ABC transporter permease [Thermoplasmata archaeon]